MPNKQDRPKTLYLIDGANYVFRAFYAIRGLSNSKGFPTNALYGFTQMLLSLMRDEKPDHVAVVFDRPEPTFRDEMYEEYKANRKEPPDELSQQFPYVIPITEALGVAVVEKAGFEADDLIGTIAAKYASDDLHVVIVSGDKDLMQLVNDNVTLLDTMKGRRVGSREVVERFGVGPEHVVDVLGLAGDASDNVPGLPSVGPKTASKLIEKYGSIENLIEHADELKPSIQAKLKEFKDQVLLSKQLVTIVLDAPVDVTVEDMLKGKPKEKELHELFSEFEFTKLLAELAPRNAEKDVAYILADDEAKLTEVCDLIREAGRCSIAVAGDAEPAGIALAWGAGGAAYVPFAHSLEIGAKQLGVDEARVALKPLFEDASLAKIAHDAKEVEKALGRWGVAVKGLAHDTTLIAYLVDPAGQTALAALASRYLDHQLPPMDEVLGKGAKRLRFADLPLDRATQVMCESADVALQLADELSPLLEKTGVDALYHETELPLIEVLREMEERGIRIDDGELARISKDFGARLAKIEKEIYDETGEQFNINSPKQLGFVLFEKMGLPGAKKTKTGYSTSQDILDDLAGEYRVPELVLAYRGLSKLKSTYVDALPQLIDPATGRVHTTFNQAVTATGRLSSSDPNLQNIPIRRPEGKSIRACFIPEEGYVFVDADYSQIELRVLAHATGDEALVSAFADGVDVHAVTASGIFGVKPADVTGEQRGVGKTVNFATIYGQSAYGLAKQLKIDVGEAGRYIDGYFAKYPEVEKYREKVLAFAKTKGYVETLFGRRRYLPDISSSNGMLRSVAERMAFNTVFQGTAADIIKRAMISIHNELPSVAKDARMLLQVHDELLFEVPIKDAEAVAAFVKERMEAAAELSVPLVVDVGIGNTWADAH